MLIRSSREPALSAASIRYVTCVSLQTALECTVVHIGYLHTSIKHRTSRLLFVAMGASIDHELDEIYAFAVQLGKDAGAMLMDAVKRRRNPQGAQNSSIDTQEKDSSVDIVTKTDHGK